MPRPKKPGAPEPKRRSRNGCWPCKRRKIKCGEERPACFMCTKSGETCDYSMRLNWHGREKRTNDDMLSVTASVDSQTKRARAGLLSPMDATVRSHSTENHLRPPALDFADGKRPSPEGMLSFTDPWQTQGGAERAAMTTARVGMQANMRSAPGAILDASRNAPGISETRFEVRMPLTPSTPGLDFSAPSTATLPRSSRQPSDADRRKLSIRSLLAHLAPDPDIDRNYGFDQGRRDMDVPRNDDASALVAFSPSATLRRLKFPSESGNEASEGLDGHGPPVELDDPQLGASKYYSSAVPVTIPYALEPLPAMLQHPMNLLYFHHFLNHTASLLVLHDCPYNVLRNVLPQMAVHNENLLNLLLAYAAHHRARLLRYAEPVNRIAQWVALVFTELQHALVDTEEGISDANVAAAIMLASLEIISPNAFEASISWQNHLGLAREFIILRGGYQGLREGDTVSRFLSRWFAYLDVLGSLSGGHDRPLPDARGLDDIPPEPNDDDDKIDCFLGFTGRCVNLLHEISELAKDCELLRLGLQDDEVHQWQPPEHIAQRAYYVESLLQNSRQAAFSGCGVRDDADVNVNDAYHLAGLIHLYRRVLDIPHTSPEVVSAVGDIYTILDSADDRRLGVLIFPIFTAGFYTQHSDDRAVVHLKRVENLGMAQAGKARQLLEDLEQNPQTWESLMTGTGAFVG